LGTGKEDMGTEFGGGSTADVNPGLSRTGEPERAELDETSNHEDEESVDLPEGNIDSGNVSAQGEEFNINEDDFDEEFADEDQEELVSSAESGRDIGSRSVPGSNVRNLHDVRSQKDQKSQDENLDENRVKPGDEKVSKAQ
jgi:hypothetical protein